MSEARERFRRALDKLQFAHGEWARTKADHPEQDRNRLADAAVAAENDVMALYDEAAARVAAGAGDPPGTVGDRLPAPSEAAQRFDEIMAQVREEQRAGRTPEQELRDALTAIRPLIEREDVEEDEWVAAFEKEVPVLVDAAYRFLEAVRPTPRAAPPDDSPNSLQPQIAALRARNFQRVGAPLAGPTVERLERIIGFAQEIQRATVEGDAHQCARHVEYEAKAALREGAVSSASAPPQEEPR